MSKLDDILIYLAKNDDLLHYSKDGANPEAKQQIKALFLELIDEDYKPSTLENDTRYTRFIAPSSQCYVTKEEAIAANYEFQELRNKVNDL